MKFFLVVVILATIYFICAKRNSNQPHPAISATSQQAATPAAAPQGGQPAASPGATSSNYFKRPLDRTHEVLDQARKNKESNSF